MLSFCNCFGFSLLGCFCITHRTHLMLPTTYMAADSTKDLHDNPLQHLTGVLL
jgi:hypothetical protein